MCDKNKDFPIYRKLPNNLRFFKIENDRLFHEKQVMGQRVLNYTIEAKQYPEMLRIKDMIELEGFELSSKDEFERL